MPRTSLSFLLVIICSICFTKNADTTVTTVPNFKKSTFSFGEKITGDRILRTILRTYNTVPGANFTLYIRHSGYYDRINNIEAIVVTNPEATVMADITQGGIGKKGATIRLRFANSKWALYKFDFIGTEKTGLTKNSDENSQLTKVLDEGEAEFSYVTYPA